jgi:hypothetical protein
MSDTTGTQGVKERVRRSKAGARPKQGRVRRGINFRPIPTRTPTVYLAKEDGGSRSWDSLGLWLIDGTSHGTTETAR